MPEARSGSNGGAAGTRAPLQEDHVSLYLEQIRQLVAVQRVDDAIHEVKTTLESMPREHETLRQRFAGIEAQRNRIIEKINHLKEQEKRLTVEIEDETARLRKSKNKLMQVSNTREYQAMSREMDGIEKRNNSREEERAALAEERRTQDTALADVSLTWSELEAQLNDSTVHMDSRMAASRSELDDLMRKRAGVGLEVPRPVLERYEFIRRRLEHPVIVPVKSGVCGGCRIAIPPQIFIELQSGQKILNCPNCQRLIYWCEHFEDRQEEDARPAQGQEQVIDA
jgi:predicted  nucleic acid-binding Zn-ribbon protein